MIIVAKRYHWTSSNIPNENIFFLRVFSFNSQKCLVLLNLYDFKTIHPFESCFNNWIEVQGTYKSIPKFKRSKETILNRKRNEFPYNVAVHGHSNSFLFTFGLILHNGLMHSDLSKVLELYSTHRQQVSDALKWYGLGERLKTRTSVPIRLWTGGFRDFNWLRLLFEVKTEQGKEKNRPMIVKNSDWFRRETVIDLCNWE